MRRWPPFASAEAAADLDFIAQRYGQRPATILGVTDLFAAYCVDGAAAWVGTTLEAKRMRELREQMAKEPTARRRTRTDSKAPATLDMGKGTLSGKVPIVRGQLPDWLLRRKAAGTLYKAPAVAPEG